MTPPPTPPSPAPAASPSSAPDLAGLARLLPLPTSITVEGAGAVGGSAAVLPPVVGVGPASDAWRLLGDEAGSTAALGSAGYVLRIRDGRPVVAATTAEGAHRGLATLAQLTAAQRVPDLTVRDSPGLPRRGVVEGFYGPPWSHDDRLGFLRFAGRVGLNEYVYAPKDDPYHRDRWRDLYPPDELAELAEIAHAAEEQHVRFAYALAPALSMRFSDPQEHERLAAKAAQLWSAGIRAMVLLFDDVPTGLAHPADVAAYGEGQRGAGRAHGDTCRRFQEGFLLPRGSTDPVTMCPTDYAGCAPSPYRDGLAETLPEDAVVLWTGADIVVGEVTREHIDLAAASYRRRVLLWDNFPVNDFDRSRLFLGPLLGRTTDLEGAPLVGIMANPMIESVPSRFALATVADWAWNPRGYDPAASSAAAVRLVAGDDPGVAALVVACSSWPPSAPQEASLSAAIDAALAGDEAAIAVVEARGRALAAAIRPDAAGEVDRTLHAWLAAARDAGAALLAACALLRQLDRRPPAVLGLERAALSDALAATESHYANVLRSVVPPFARAVLARAGVLPAAEERTAASVVLLTGSNPAPGDRDLSERLVARGHRVTTTAEWPADRPVDLVLITAAAPRDAALAVRALPVPVLAWGRLETLGLATASIVLLSHETVEIEAPDDPLASGLDGVVRIHRGPAAITALQPVAGARVIARAGGEPVLVRVPAGVGLTDGRPAPAERVAFFLGPDGLAPWLITRDGHALFAAAVDHLLEQRSAVRPEPVPAATAG